MVPKKFINFILMQRLMKVLKRLVTLITPQNSPCKEIVDEKYCINKSQSEYFYQNHLKFIEVDNICRKFIFSPFFNIKQDM